MKFQEKHLNKNLLNQEAGFKMIYINYFRNFE